MVAGTENGTLVVLLRLRLPKQIQYLPLSIGKYSTHPSEVRVRYTQAALMARGCAGEAVPAGRLLTCLPRHHTAMLPSWPLALASMAPRRLDAAPLPRRRSPPPPPRHATALLSPPQGSPAGRACRFVRVSFRPIVPAATAPRHAWGAYGPPPNPWTHHELMTPAQLVSGRPPPPSRPGAGDPGPITRPSSATATTNPSS